MADSPKFTLSTTNVVSFDSTRSSTGAVQTTFHSVQTDPIVTTENGTAGPSMSENYCQTDPITMQKLSDSEELKLAAWLKKILPEVEAELEAGVTYIPEEADQSKLTVRKHSVIDVGATFLKGEVFEHVDKGNASWLSLSTMNAPVLVLSVSASSHQSWCDHQSLVTVWRPRRNGANSVGWSEVKSIPVKACIESLTVNSFNRDIFSAGTVTGDLYIWKYLYNEPEPIQEVYAESTQYGGIVGIDFQKLPVDGDYAVLTCHNDGHIIQWKLAKNVVKDKIMRAFNMTKGEGLALTALVSINATEFICGTVDGLLLRCSTLHPKNLDTHLDPVNETFSRQSFTITQLQVFDKYLMSCDASSEVHVYDLEQNSLLRMVKMTLPLNQKYACLNFEYILGAGLNGELSTLKVDSDQQELIENGLRGAGSCIEISRNRKWVVTGAYEGKFQIFEIDLEV